MIKLITFERKTSYGNIRKCSAYMVNDGTHEWMGAGYKNPTGAAVFDWFCQQRKLNANFVMPVQGKLL